MSYWITVFVSFIVLLLVAEELIYYSWNRYVYGPNLERRSKWKNRWTRIWKKLRSIIVFFKKKQLTDIEGTEINKEKSSM